MPPLETAGIALTTALSLRVGWRLANAVEWGWDLPGLLACGLLGLAAADFVAGLVHWAGDRFFAPDTPFLGPALIVGFREHHRDPAAILRHSLIERSGMNFLAVAPLLVGADAAVSAATHAGRALAAGLAALAWALACTNELHAWAHAARVPRPVRWLQRARLVLPPDVHARHHRGRFDSHYCVTTGWLNPVLDRLLGARVPRRPAARDRRGGDLP